MAVKKKKREGGRGDESISHSTVCGHLPGFWLVQCGILAEMEGVRAIGAKWSEFGQG